MRGYAARVDPARFGWATHAIVALFCEGRRPPRRSARPSSTTPRSPPPTPWRARRARSARARAGHVAPRGGARADPRPSRRDPHADADRAVDALRAAVRLVAREGPRPHPAARRAHRALAGLDAVPRRRARRPRRGGLLVARRALPRAQRHAPRRAGALRPGRGGGGRHPGRAARAPGRADRRARAVRGRPGVDARRGRRGGVGGRARRDPRRRRGPALHGLGRVRGRTRGAISATRSRIRATGAMRRRCWWLAAWPGSGSTRSASTPGRTRAPRRCTRRRCRQGSGTSRGSSGSPRCRRSARRS